AEALQVVGLDLAQDLAGAPLVRVGHLGREADRGALAAAGDDLLQAGEGAAADEQHVGGVDLQELLLRVLAPALRGHRGDGAFHDLQEGLLHALAGHVAGDRGVVRLAADLVDLVDVDDAALRALDVVVGGLQQLEDDVLDVLADVAGLGEGGGVGHRERHVDDSSQGLRQQRLADAGGADQQDVGLGQLDVVVLLGVAEALVVIVHGNRQDLLGVVLPAHVIVEHLADLARRRHPVLRLHEGDLVLFANDIHAQLDAFIADEHGGTRDELTDLVLALAAERAVQGALAVAARGFGHLPVSLSYGAWATEAPAVNRTTHTARPCRIRAVGCLILDIPRSGHGSQASLRDSGWVSRRSVSMSRTAKRADPDMGDTAQERQP